MLKIRRVRQNLLQVMMIVVMMMMVVAIMLLLLLLLVAIVPTDLASGTGRTGARKIWEQHTEVEISTGAAHRYRDSTRSLHHVLVRFLMRHRLRLRLCLLFVQVTMARRGERSVLLGRVR